MKADLFVCAAHGEGLKSLHMTPKCSVTERKKERSAGDYDRVNKKYGAEIAREIAEWTKKGRIHL